MSAPVPDDQDETHDDLRRPFGPEDPSAYRRKILLGIGIPSLLAGIVAIALGIPWWIVLIFLAVVALGTVLNT